MRDLHCALRFRLDVLSRGLIRRERVGQTRNQIVELQIVDWAVELSDGIADNTMQGRVAYDRILDERQRARSKRVSDQPWRDIDDAIGKASVRSGAAVVLLVGMDDKGAAGLAVLRRAAIAERLHAAQRDPDRVAVVAMRRKAHRGEVRLGALEAWPRRTAADPVCPAARSFKTGCRRAGQIAVLARMTCCPKAWRPSL